jgi:hypothetical protein
VSAPWTACATLGMTLTLFTTLPAGSAMADVECADIVSPLAVLVWLDLKFETRTDTERRPEPQRADRVKRHVRPAIERAENGAATRTVPNAEAARWASHPG